MSTVLELSPASDWLQRGNAAPLPPAKLTRFNRGFLDRTDPLEGTGVRMENFSFASVYQVSPEKQGAVLESLYRRVYARLRTEGIALGRPGLMDYDDVRTGSYEQPRRYVVVRGDTVRSTHMDVFATFRSYGDYLYVSVDSFLLPPLSILRVLWATVVALWVTWWASLFTAPMGMTFEMMGKSGAAWLFSGPKLGFLFVTCPLLMWWNRDVIRSVRHGDPFGIALQRHYFRWRATSAFDTDDVLAYFKSTTLLIAEEVTAVFNENGIPVGDLQQIQQTINLTTAVTNSGVMNVLGSMLVGAGNSLSGARK
jgi:hypothetical protein